MSEKLYRGQIIFDDLTFCESSERESVSEVLNYLKSAMEYNQSKMHLMNKWQIQQHNGDYWVTIDWGQDTAGIID